MPDMLRSAQPINDFLVFYSLSLSYVLGDVNLLEELSCKGALAYRAGSQARCVVIFASNKIHAMCSLSCLQAKGAQWHAYSEQT